jgi:hypothetical protein
MKKRKIRRRGSRNGVRAGEKRRMSDDMKRI